MTGSNKSDDIEMSQQEHDPTPNVVDLSPKATAEKPAGQIDVTTLKPNLWYLISYTIIIGFNT